MTRKKSEIRKKGPFIEEVMRTMPVLCYEEIAEINAEHEVFLVRHTSSGQIRVRKKCSPDMRPVYEYLKKARLPGIPKIFALCEESGTLTVVEEFVPGRSLREFLNSHGPLNPTRAAFYTACLASTLERMHCAVPPIIHRDIKPENVIIADNGELYLVDFGAAKFVLEGKKRDTSLLGTPGYAAPEQYGFAPSGPETDVYALGIVFYEMVGKTRERSIPIRVGEVMKKATNALPENRFRNAGELKRALLQCLSLGVGLTFLAGERYRNSINKIERRKRRKKK